MGNKRKAWGNKRKASKRKATPLLVGPDGVKKCHEACGKICLQIPGPLLNQLTAVPLHQVRRLDITSDLKKVHMKSLFQSLGEATGLEEINIDGGRSGSFSDMAEEMAVVLSRCNKI